MEIKVKTIYGNVNLKSCYDCDSSSDFYSAYDDNDHYLGNLWNIPYYDENDDESIACLTVALETAIECHEICIPSEDKNNYNGEPEKIFIMPKSSKRSLQEIDDTLVEYVHKDSFIEKACDSIKHLLSGYIIRNFHSGDSYKIDMLIENFKNNMKEE